MLETADRLTTFPDVGDASEKNLRQIEKCLGQMIRASENEQAINGTHTKQISELLRVALITTNTLQITPSHRVAACNVLCGLSELCARSSDERLRSMAYNDDFYISLLHVYLDRFEISKGKSMKQLLGTLIKILQDFGQYDLSNDLIGQVLVKLFDILFWNRDHTRAKPSLFVLSALLSRDIIPISSVLHLSKSKTLPTQFSRCEQPDEVPVMQALLRGILDWMLYSDLAPAVGHLFGVLLNCKQHDASRADTSTYPDTQRYPEWTIPIVEAAERRPEHIRLLKVYLFPTIFKIDLHGYWGFLFYLNINQYISSKPNGTQTALEDKIISKDCNEMLLFASLQVGKATSLIRESGSLITQNIEIHSGSIWIPERFLGNLLCDPATEVRLAGLSLLTTSPFSTRPMTIETLEYLKRYLPPLFTEVDANARGETNSLILALVDRLRAITFNLSRKLSHSASKSARSTNRSSHAIDKDSSCTYSQADQHSYVAHESFVQWFLAFVVSELVSTASYQRHASALKSLKILIRSGIDADVPTGALSRQAKGDVAWSFHLAVFTPTVVRLLIDLLLDPFDDVRQNAVSLLQIAFSQQFYHKVETLNESLARANKLMLDTGRLDHADGVACIHSLLCFCLSGRNLVVKNDTVTVLAAEKWQDSYFDILANIIKSIEEGIQMSKANFAAAVSSFPLHGLFTSLKYSLEQAPALANLDIESSIRLAQLVDRISNALINIWRTVRDILCNDAPEGFMPEEVDAEVELTTKDVLSYSWRALKEASLLLRQLAATQLIATSLVSSTHNRLRLFGDLCFEQLAELRHRGAFSTVAQTFIAVCQRCANDAESETISLLEIWYNRILDLITEKGSITTRRSAGIPALLVAVLSANESEDLFEGAMADLQKLSVLGVDQIVNEELPQVHALNCLKAVFLTTKLSSKSDQHIAAVLKVAATALGSSIWAIRNCGLMLFRSLVDRIISANESQQVGTLHGPFISWNRYPGLIETLLHILRDASQGVSPKSNIGAEAVFLVLDIFRRTRGPASFHAEIRELILQATASTHWHVRNIAAQAFAASSKSDSIVSEFQFLLALDFQHCPPNTIHGRALAVKYATGMFLDTAGSLNSEHHTIAHILDAFSAQNIVAYSSHAFAITPIFDALFTIGQRLLNDSTARSQQMIQNTTVFLSTSKIAVDLVRKNHKMRNDPSLKKSCGALMSIWTLLAIRTGSSQEMFVSSPEDIFLDILDPEDPDTSDYVIQAIGSVHGLVSCDGIELFVCVLARLVTSNALRSAVASSTLANTLDLCSGKAESNHEEKIRAYLCEYRIMQQLFNSLSPSEAESNIRLWSHSICARRCTLGSWEDQNLLLETKACIEAAWCALDEWNDYTIRYSAVQSLWALAHAVSSQPQWSHDADAAFYFAVYNALIDDDEDIRSLASEALTLSLSRPKAVNPPAACQLLFKHLVHRHGVSAQLMSEAIRRITNQTQDAFNKTPRQSVRHRLKEHLRPDNSLFAVEKQNLYLDPIKDAEMWAQVLKRLSVSYLPEFLVNNFADWVMDGLKALSQYAQQQNDGPLGWTSKPDVFALGMRVIFGADVILEWRRRTRKVKVKGSEVRRALAKLAEIGKATALHEVWIEHIEMVISRSIVTRLRRIHDVLAVLPVQEGKS